MGIQLEKTLIKYGLFGRDSSRTFQISKRNMAAQLQFSKWCLSKPQVSRNNVLFTKVEMHGYKALCHIWQKTKQIISAQTLNAKFQPLWCKGDDFSFTANTAGNLAVIQSTMNSSLYHSI